MCDHLNVGYVNFHICGKTPWTQPSFVYLRLNNFPYRYPGEKRKRERNGYVFLSCYFSNLVGGDIITVEATNWLGQCRTAALCWFGRRQQVILLSAAPKQTSFSHVHTAAGPAASISDKQKTTFYYYI